MTLARWTVEAISRSGRKESIQSFSNPSFCRRASWSAALAQIFSSSFARRAMGRYGSPSRSSMYCLKVAYPSVR